MPEGRGGALGLLQEGPVERLDQMGVLQRQHREVLPELAWRRSRACG